jgi:hypothetical protein
MPTELWFALCLVCLAIGMLIGMVDTYYSRKALQRTVLASLEKPV